MCYPLFAAAFCAVFAPAPVHADAPLPAQARPALAAIPAGRTADEAAPISLDLPEGRRGEALPDQGELLAARQTRVTAPALATRAAQESRTDTEAKGSSGESDAADGGEAGDTERK